jgi:hypothetical protein
MHSSNKLYCRNFRKKHAGRKELTATTLQPFLEFGQVVLVLGQRRDVAGDDSPPLAGVVIRFRRAILLLARSAIGQEQLAFANHIHAR